MSADPTLSVPPGPPPTVTSGDSTPTPAPFTGRQFGDYELLEEIDRGGMGIVYKARQISLNRIVALKMILSGKLASVADLVRFRQEAETAANLDHSNIMPIYEVGEHEEYPYFSMKLAYGGPLSRHIAEFVREPRTAAKLIEQIARGMNYAHQFGLLHRDLKPANILLDADRTPLITDFGLAKNIKGDSGLTQSGAVLGTPSYMAPEQARGEKQITIAADIYSLGAMLYELLTGKPPFRGETMAQTIRMVEEEEPKSARSINAAADYDLEAIALKCLEKDPARRYATAGAMADDLAAWQRGEPVTARRAGWARRAKKWVRRNPAVAGLSAAVVIALIAGSIVSAMYAVRASQRAAEAKKNEQEARLQEITVKDREEVLKDTLCVALFQRAQAERLARRPGWRSRALGLLNSAAEMRLRERPASTNSVDMPDLADIRSEAVMALTADDARKVREIPLTFSSTTIISTNGSHLAQTWVKPGPDPQVTMRLINLQTGKSEDIDSKKLNDEGVVALNNIVALDAEARRALCRAPTPDRAFGLRDVATGKIIVELGKPGDNAATAQISRARFSPDGKKVAIVDIIQRAPGDKNVEKVFQIWDLSRPNAPSELERRPSRIEFEFSFGMDLDIGEFAGMRFSSDSKRICYLSSDRKRVHIRDISVDPPATIPVLPFPGQIITVEWHPTLPVLAILSSDADQSQQATITFWDVSQNRSVLKRAWDLASRETELISMGFSPDGRWLAIGGGHNPAIDILGGSDATERFQVLDNALVGIHKVFWTPDSQLAVAGLMEGLRIYQLDTQSVCDIVASFHAAGRPAFSPDGKKLAVFAPVTAKRRSSVLDDFLGNREGKPSTYDRIALINRETGAIERFLPGINRLNKPFYLTLPIEGPVRVEPHATLAESYLHFSPDGRRLLLGQTDLLIAYDCDSGKEIIRKLPPTSMGINSWDEAFYLPDGRLASLGVRDAKPTKKKLDAERQSVVMQRRLVLWDVAGEKPIHEFDDSESKLSEFRHIVSADGGHFYCNRTVVPFEDLEDKKPEPSLDRIYELPSCRLIAEVPRGKDDDKQMIDVEALTSGARRTLAINMNFFEEGASLRNTYWTIRDLPSGEERLRIPNRGFVEHGQDFSADSRFVALAADKGYAEIWDVEARTLLFRWQPHGNKGAEFLRFSADGDLATLSQNDDKLSILRMKALRDRLAPMGLGW